MPRARRAGGCYDDIIPSQEDVVLKLITRLACSLAVVGGLLWASEHDAKALGPIDLEAGLKVGAGTNPNSAGTNPFGFGVGARGGVSLFHLYLGLDVEHYFGGSQDFAGLKTDVSTNMFGGAVGYTIGAIPFLQIRPLIGFGDAWFHSSVDNVSNSGKTDSNFYLEPGLTVLIPFGLIYVGADANVLILPGIDAPTTTDPNATKTYTSFTFHGQIGIRI